MKVNTDLLKYKEMVKGNDNGDLVINLSKNLKNEKLLNEMGHCARKYALTHADSHKCLDRLESFYLSVVKQDEKSMVQETVELA